MQLIFFRYGIVSDDKSYWPSLAMFTKFNIRVISKSMFDKYASIAA